MTTTTPIRAYGKIRISDGASASHAARVITLYNPERRNAIGPQMVSELLYALEDAHADTDVRTIVLTGEGKAFCAGGDFGQMTGGAADGPALPPKGDYADLLLAMAHTEKPIIARVNGPAMGGGLGIVAASTFAVADREATLGTPEINVGLFPMMIMAILTRVIPRRQLLDMMLLGKKVSGAEAAEMGLVTRAVAGADLDATVAELTGELAKKSPLTIALGLRAFAAQDDMDLENALPMLRDKLGEMLTTEDAREGLMAFLQKRAPVWKGR